MGHIVEEKTAGDVGALRAALTDLEQVVRSAYPIEPPPRPGYAGSKIHAALKRAAQTLVSSMTDVPPWRSITEADPPMGRVVLLAYFRDLGEPTDCWIIASGYRGAPKTMHDSDEYTPWTMDGRSLKEWDWLPTRWMPLPSPPDRASRPPLPPQGDSK